VSAATGNDDLIADALRRAREEDPLAKAARIAREREDARAKCTEAQPERESGTLNGFDPRSVADSIRSYGGPTEEARRLMRISGAARRSDT
jgi:hypothetical protein